ncbi:MAG: translation initiation factor IF-3 [Puniceicoccales bacterium]|jgi:translation initiation factor IF-3|nr:translation initiation factor IF-3 [Puniceicoccales bacterium]
MSGTSSFRPRAHYGKRPREPFIRKNERIRAEAVRVINPEGKQLGILSIGEALRLARDCGLDLIEISPNANPPVCKIADFGKHQYEEGKRQKGQKDSSSRLKEVKFRLNIEAHDFETKVKHGIAFLQEGNKLKIALILRFREMERQAFGLDIIRRAMAELSAYGTPDAEPRLSGREIAVMFSPKSSANRLKPSVSTTLQVDLPSSAPRAS